MLTYFRFFWYGILRYRHFGIEGIVRAKTGILAGVELCAVLADDDLAPLHDRPPKRLTPRRWELESRPLRELPPPFLCAISELLNDDLIDLDEEYC